MNSGSIPPPPPRRVPSSLSNERTTGSHCEAPPKANSGLLSSIQKGVKLKKAAVVNDRSAPKIGISKETQNHVQSIVNTCKEENRKSIAKNSQLQGLFANGFPQFKKAPQKHAENNETKDSSQTIKQITFLDRDQNQCKPTLTKPTTPSNLMNNEPKYNSKEILNQHNSFLPQKSSEVIPQKIYNSDRNWSFNSKFVPTQPQSFTNPIKKYQSGASKGLNQFCPDAAKLNSFEEKQNFEEVLHSTKSKLKNSLQKAISEEQFELCVEIKQYIRELDNSKEPSAINKLVNEIEQKLHI